MLAGISISTFFEKSLGHFVPLSRRDRQTYFHIQSVKNLTYFSTAGGGSWGSSEAEHSSSELSAGARGNSQTKSPPLVDDVQERLYVHWWARGSSFTGGCRSRLSILFMWWKWRRGWCSGRDMWERGLHRLHADGQIRPTNTGGTGTKTQRALGCHARTCAIDCTLLEFRGIASRKMGTICRRILWAPELFQDQSSFCVQCGFPVHGLPKFETLATWEGLGRCLGQFVQDRLGYWIPRNPPEPAGSSRLSRSKMCSWCRQQMVLVFEAQGHGRGAENSSRGLCRLLWWDWVGTWLSERHSFCGLSALYNRVVFLKVHQDPKIWFPARTKLCNGWILEVVNNHGSHEHYLISSSENKAWKNSRKGDMGKSAKRPKMFLE